MIYKRDCNGKVSIIGPGYTLWDDQCGEFSYGNQRQITKSYGTWLVVEFLENEREKGELHIHELE